MSEPDNDNGSCAAVSYHTRPHVAGVARDALFVIRGTEGGQTMTTFDKVYIGLCVFAAVAFLTAAAAVWIVF